MDSKIKSLTAYALTICAFVLTLIFCPSCKKNDWADWKVQNEVWLINNAAKDSVQVSSTGLQYKIIADPTPQDARPNLNSTVVCDYTLKLINGAMIDAGNNVALNLSNTIAGFAEGCHKIHSNGDIELFIPAYLGYDKAKYDTNDYSAAEGFGTEGTQSYIPPYSTLIYTVHICGVMD